MRDYNLSQENVCARCGDKGNLHVCIPVVIDMLSKSKRFWFLVLTISSLNLLVIMVLAKVFG
jgi:hypothetical protein